MGNDVNLLNIGITYSESKCVINGTLILLADSDMLNVQDLGSSTSSSATMSKAPFFEYRPSANEKYHIHAKDGKIIINKSS